MMDNGMIIICMVKESTPGVTAENTKVNILVTRSTDMEYITGQTAGATRGCGRMGSRTARASIFCRMGSPKLAFGTTASG